MRVPSHAGISGNERADKSTNEATLPHNALKINQTTSSESLDTFNLKILDTWEHGKQNGPTFLSQIN